MELSSRSVDESEERSQAEPTVRKAGVVPVGPPQMPLMDHGDLSGQPVRESSERASL